MSKEEYNHDLKKIYRRIDKETENLWGLHDGIVIPKR